MKKIILIILFTSSVFAQNVWYVHRDASGANTGRSWTDAWNYFDSSGWAGTGGINWAIIQPGDTIYVSGGTDSLTYSTNTSYGFWISPDTRRTFEGNPPVLTPAWHTGHNGIVRIVSTNSSHTGILRVRNINNIKITGFVFEDRRSSGGGAHIMLGDYSGDSHYYFDNNHVIGRGNITAVHLAGYHITVRNNVIENLLNNNIADCDMITISGGGGSFTIDRNIIIQRNTNTETDAHRDMIQISNLYGDESVRIPIIISNNLIIETEAQGTSWNNMVYNYGWDVTPRIDMRIYNNIIVNRKYQSSIGGFGIGRLTGDNPITLRIFNNTVINKGNGTSSSMLANWGTDTLLVYNNLFVADTSASNVININTDLILTQFNYNHYARYGASESSFAVRSATYTWTQWRGLGFDANSTLGANSSVTFDNKYGTNIEDYYTITGRGAGLNLWDNYSYLREDILGNPRPESGAWDIGALQFIESGSADTIPSYSFTPVTDAELNTLYEASAVFSGADSTFTVYTSTSADFKIGALDTYSAITKYAEAGDTVFIQNTSSAEYSTLTTQTLVAGGVTRSFNVTTKAEPPPPTPSQGGWLNQVNGRKLFFNNGRAILTRQE